MSDISRCSNFISFILLLMVLNLLNNHKNADILCNTINRAQNIASWLSSNKLSLNLKKTQFMIFKTKGKKF